MNARQDILSRIKQALRVKTVHTGHSEPSNLDICFGAKDLRSWMPPGGMTDTERWVLFCEAAKALRLSVYADSGDCDLETHLIRIAQEEGWKKVASHAGTLTGPACDSLGLPVCWTDEKYELAELESCDAALTECEALVAQTGSILVSTRRCGGRALTVLPPHHLVLASREQLIPDLAAAFSLLKERYTTNYPSFITFITGASRTGDIERTLVLGAHGPRKLTVLVSGH